ncbi:SRPBCC domain-containing protein [Methanobacterium sp.]|uniref:SRPBCC domain-containing protein n=1 Tax=Methanobacterium sp. TaxID=2164 RepID=UPI002AB99053|nr:SRPBCC domain-containing protein [Methanobacterium sp.]MDY9923825.1 SRPBCC domain-containing protein [Methanobacterium sp.]
MKEIYTEIEINAPASKVWSILNDFEKFPTWNPFMKKISGNLQEGSDLKAFIQPPNSSGMTIKPKILEYHAGKELRWLGRLWIPKLFDGEHSWITEEINENKTLFIQKERFSGLFVPFGSTLLKNTKTGFEMMNRALKEEAEKKIIN